MSLKNKIQVKLHQRALANQSTNQVVDRHSIPFDQIKEVCLLFNGTQLENREIAQRFAKRLRDQGKNIRLFAYIDDKELSGASLPFKFITKKELNISLIPQGSEVTDLINFPFDVLINLTPEEILPLDYIAIRSKAKFRVGPNTGKSDAYELMIDISKNDDLEYFAKQVSIYLNKMNQQPSKI